MYWQTSCGSECFVAQEMDRVIDGISLVSQALQTNFWGLGCPLHYSQFPASAFVLAGIVGWLLGVATVLAVVWAFVLPLGFPHLSSSSRTSPASSRLAQYLHERGLVVHRRGWAHSQLSRPPGHCLWASKACCRAGFWNCPSSSSSRSIPCIWSLLLWGLPWTSTSWFSSSHSPIGR